MLITLQQQSVQLSATPCPELRQAPCIAHCLDNFSNDKLSPQIRFEGYYCISQEHAAFEMSFCLVLGVLEVEASQLIGICHCIMRTPFGNRHLYKGLLQAHE